ncbi:hypothetical protein ACJRO7_003418 [Eucalyptus globulus]|uniref:Uncharacterized protein n=1 Tax=Eucalyptus globulus TaxID=34317 RepID=A0ABD3IVP8_EUCGL
MSWNMDIQYVNTGYPYNTSKIFMEYFEGLTYEHVNFIFYGVLMLKYLLESIYPPMNTNHYKMGPSEYAYHEIRRPMVSSSMTNKQTPAVSSGWEGNANSGSRGHSVASLPNSHHKSLAWFFPRNLIFVCIISLGYPYKLATGNIGRDLTKGELSRLVIGHYFEDCQTLVSKSVLHQKSSHSDNFQTKYCKIYCTQTLHPDSTKRNTSPNHITISDLVWIPHQDLFD